MNDNMCMLVMAKKVLRSLCIFTPPQHCNPSTHPWTSKLCEWLSTRTLQARQSRWTCTTLKSWKEGTHGTTKGITRPSRRLTATGVLSLPSTVKHLGKPVSASTTARKLSFGCGSTCRVAQVVNRRKESTHIAYALRLHRILPFVVPRVMASTGAMKYTPN